jgi:hypothetical protein
MVVLLNAFGDSEDETSSHLQQLKATAPPGALMSQVVVPTDMQQQYDFGALAIPEGHRWVADNVYLDDAVDFAAVVKPAFTTLPPDGMGFWEPMNPISHAPPIGADGQSMALSMHTDHYVALYAAYKDALQDKHHNTWIRSYMTKYFGKHSVGAYLGDADFQAHDNKFWSDEVGRKLMKTRRKWDPQGRLCGYLNKGDSSGVDGPQNTLKL